MSSVVEENCLNNVGACKIAQYKYIPSPVLMRVSRETLFSACVLYVHFPRSDCVEAKAVSWRRTRRPASPGPGMPGSPRRGTGPGARTPRPCQRGAARRFPQARIYESAGGQCF